MKRKHYIAMSGSHGCIPDHCQSHDTEEEAIADLVTLFDLSPKCEEELTGGLYLELTAGDGAEYCEITECDCNDPESHNDT